MSEEFVLECIAHKDTSHIQVRYDFLCLYHGNETKAKIIRVLESWTNTKRAEWYKKALDAREQKQPIPVMDLWITMSYQQFSLFMYGTVKQETIKKSVKELLATGDITSRPHPENPYGPPQYLLDTDKIQEGINKLPSPYQFDPLGAKIPPPPKLTPSQGVHLPRPRGYKQGEGGGKDTPTLGAKIPPFLEYTKNHLDNSEITTQENVLRDAANADITGTPIWYSHPEYSFVEVNDLETPSEMRVTLTPAFPHPFFSEMEDKRRERVVDAVMAYFRQKGCPLEIQWLYEKTGTPSSLSSSGEEEYSPDLDYLTESDSAHVDLDNNWLPDLGPGGVDLSGLVYGQTTSEGLGNAAMAYPGLAAQSGRGISAQPAFTALSGGRAGHLEIQTTIPQSGASTTLQTHTQAEINDSYSHATPEDPLPSVSFLEASGQDSAHGVSHAGDSDTHSHCANDSNADPLSKNAQCEAANAEPHRPDRRVGTTDVLRAAATQATSQEIAAQGATNGHMDHHLSHRFGAGTDCGVEPDPLRNGASEEPELARSHVRGGQEQPSDREHARSMDTGGIGDAQNLTGHLRQTVTGTVRDGTAQLNGHDPRVASGSALDQSSVVGVDGRYRDTELRRSQANDEADRARNGAKSRATDGLAAGSHTEERRINGQSTYTVSDPGGAVNGAQPGVRADFAGNTQSASGYLAGPDTDRGNHSEYRPELSGVSAHDGRVGTEELNGPVGTGRASDGRNMPDPALCSDNYQSRTGEREPAAADHQRAPAAQPESGAAGVRAGATRGRTGRVGKETKKTDVVGKGQYVIPDLRNGLKPDIPDVQRPLSARERKRSIDLRVEEFYALYERLMDAGRLEHTSDNTKTFKAWAEAEVCDSDIEITFQELSKDAFMADKITPQILARYRIAKVRAYRQRQKQQAAPPTPPSPSPFNSFTGIAKRADAEHRARMAAKQQQVVGG